MSDSQDEMRIDPSRAQALVSQLSSVKERIAAVANGRKVCMTLTLTLTLKHHKIYPGLHSYQVRLVAVSKLKPVNDILALHQAPTSHTHFGENYSQELTQKAALLPKTIQWHFIGGLQSSKRPGSHVWNHAY